MDFVWVASSIRLFAVGLRYCSCLCFVFNVLSCLVDRKACLYKLKVLTHRNLSPITLLRGVGLMGFVWIGSWARGWGRLRGESDVWGLVGVLVFLLQPLASKDPPQPTSTFNALFFRLNTGHITNFARTITAQTFLRLLLSWTKLYP